MSTIDKLKSAAAKAVDNFDPTMFVETRDVLALLDELEAKDTSISEQTGTIANQEKWIRGIEEAMITATDRAKAAEKRIADYQELISGLVGVSSSILREVERINNAAAAGKGEAS